jgi:hypothetical protein
VEIASGLAAGERVVSPAAGLVDGAELAPQKSAFRFTPQVPLAPPPLPPSATRRRKVLRRGVQASLLPSAGGGADMDRPLEHPIPRSEAHLVLGQPVDPTYVTKCLKELGATRVCGLGAEAVRHLQYTVSSFYTRNPRDDHAWPSREDFTLKAVWLESELARVNLSSEERTDYVKELDFVRGVLVLE